MEKLQMSNKIRWTVIRLSILMAVGMAIALTMLAIQMDAIVLLLSCIVASSIILYIGIARSQWAEEQKTLRGRDEFRYLSTRSVPDNLLLKLPFHAKRPLTLSEKTLYFRMVQSLPENIIIPQVPFHRFVGINHERKYMEWFKRIVPLSADFLVCDMDFHVVAVVDIDDDTSGIREERKAIREEKDKVLAAAGIRIIRWSSGNIPSRAAIKDEFETAAAYGTLAFLGA